MRTACIVCRRPIDQKKDTRSRQFNYRLCTTRCAVEWAKTECRGYEFMVGIEGEREPHWRRFARTRKKDRKKIGVLR